MMRCLQGLPARHLIRDSRVEAAARSAVTVATSHLMFGGDFELEKSVSKDLPSRDLLQAIGGRSPLAPGVRRQLRSFQSDPTAFGIIFKNTPMGNLPLEGGIGKESIESKLALCSLVHELATPVGYEELRRDGSVSRDFFKSIYTGMSEDKSTYLNDYTHKDSDRVFGWHTENLVHPFMPRYVALLCLRPDVMKKVETLFLPANDLACRVSSSSLAILTQKRFALKAEPSFRLQGEASSDTISELMPVLKRTHDGSWHLYVDSVFLGAADGDCKAKAALEELLEVAEQCIVPVKLEAGDLIIWDNLRASHDARHKNGAGRWLMRMQGYSDLVSPFLGAQCMAPSFVTESTCEPNVLNFQSLERTIPSRPYHMEAAPRSSTLQA